MAATLEKSADNGNGSSRFNVIKDLLIPIILVVVSIWGGYNAATKSSYETFVTKDEFKTVRQQLDHTAEVLNEIRVSVGVIEARTK